jgi:hypothetical protein
MHGRHDQPLVAAGFQQQRGKPLQRRVGVDRRIWTAGLDSSASMMPVLSCRQSSSGVISTGITGNPTRGTITSLKAAASATISSKGMSFQRR